MLKFMFFFLKSTLIIQIEIKLSYYAKRAILYFFFSSQLLTDWLEDAS